MSLVRELEGTMKWVGKSIPVGFHPAKLLQAFKRYADIPNPFAAMKMPEVPLTEQKPFQAGDRTTAGLILKHSPSLQEPEDGKFAVFSEEKLCDPNRYLELAPFLPKEFSFVDPPKVQNCFGFVLNVFHEVDHRMFSKDIHALGYRAVKKEQLKKEGMQKGDIVAYFYLDETQGYTHAARAVSAERVQSRWGYGSPVIEHPVEEVLSSYRGIFGGYFVFRKVL